MEFFKTILLQRSYIFSQAADFFFGDVRIGSRFDF